MYERVLSPLLKVRTNVRHRHNARPDLFPWPSPVVDFKLYSYPLAGSKPRFTTPGPRSGSLPLLRHEMRASRTGVQPYLGPSKNKLLDLLVFGP